MIGLMSASFSRIQRISCQVFFYKQVIAAVLKVGDFKFNKKYLIANF